MNSDRLQLLAQKYLNNTATPEEEQELNSWYHSQNEQEAVWEIAEEQDATALKNRLLQSLRTSINSNNSIIPRLPFYRRTSWQLAASLIILLAAGSFFWFSRYAAHTSPAVVDHSTNKAVVPGGNKAVLTLADGSEIILDSAANNTLAQQGNTVVIKLDDGQLAYRDQQASGTGDVLYNTIATPRGGQYQVILPDGSRVWLNAASSLRFPTAFTGNERKVSITGEVYFEVAHNPANPFLVSVRGQEIKVLGTHFNVMAYEDEQAIKTTLLEGAVSITPDDNKIQRSSVNKPYNLSPGQQAQLLRNGAMDIINDANVEEAVAWKNGRFYFDNASIQTIMRQVARWYDVEVVFEKDIPNELYNGEISRSSSIDEVFDILTLSHIHFKLEGNKVIVMP